MRRAIQNTFRKLGYKVVPIRSVPADVRTMGDLLYFSDMYKTISDVKGDIVECGVGAGRTFLYLSYLVSLDHAGRQLWGFDSFEGFPDPSPEDASFRKPKRGQWKGNSPADIKQVLHIAGIPGDFAKNRTRLVSGFFPRA